MHWVDTVLSVVDSRITKLIADIDTIIPMLKKPVDNVNIFSASQNNDGNKVILSTEDYDSIIFRMGNVMHVVFYCISDGCRIKK